MTKRRPSTGTLVGQDDQEKMLFLASALTGDYNGLLGAFSWTESEQGYQFWSDVCDRLYSGEALSDDERALLEKRMEDLEKKCRVASP